MVECIGCECGADNKGGEGSGGGVGAGGGGLASKGGAGSEGETLSIEESGDGIEIGVKRGKRETQQMMRMMVVVE
jgi:hypothetical protein